MEDKNQYNHFRGDIWFNRQVDRRTREAISKLHMEFALTHQDDTNAELLAYVRRCAVELGHSPNQDEVIGGEYISSRFGNWRRVIQAAGLHDPGKTPAMKNRRIYKQEFKRQARLFKAERQANQKTRLAEKQAASAAARQELQERKKRDADWAQAHRHDTDEQLLDHVRQTAKKLGRTPVARDVLGSTYITRRIGCWPLVLTCAGLPLPKGMRPPNDHALQAYRARRKKS